MPFRLPLPAMLSRVFYQFPFNPVATAQPRGIRRCGHELGTREVQFTLARTLLGKPEAASQLKFCIAPPRRRTAFRLGS
ncbi:MAG: hypothetical protein PVS3B1_26540 [Ktedonobacteraceae bacterium]